ncbi:MAG: YkgJ family cysteine cluster protein [Acidaminobacteraceae bacterium]
MEIRLYDEEIEESLDLLNNSGLKVQVESLLNSLASGDCAGCTKCCSESVNTSYTEFIRIYEYLEEREELFNDLLAKIFNYYFLEPVKRQKCPFLSELGRCLIYPVRPLPCRIFGFLSEEDYNKNLSQINDSNNAIAKDFKENYGLVIPSEVMNFNIDYCKDFKSDDKLTLDQRDEIIEKFINFDSIFFKKDLLDENFINQSLVSWFMYLYYDMDSLSENRIMICRDYLKFGKSKILASIVESL